MAIRNFVVNGKWVDNISIPANKTAQNVKNAHSDMSKTSGRLVDENMGRAWGQFNEKTEKARQLLNLAGTSMGGVAGEAVYLTGTIGSFVGKATMTELAIMGVVGAISVMGWAIWDFATKKSARAIDSLEKMKKRSEGLRATFADIRRETYELETGFKGFEVTVNILNEEVKDGQERIKDLEEKIRHGRVDSLKQLDEMKEELRVLTIEWRQKQGEAKEANQLYERWQNAKSHRDRINAAVREQEKKEREAELKAMKDALDAERKRAAARLKAQQEEAKALAYKIQLQRLATQEAGREITKSQQHETWAKGMSDFSYLQENLKRKEHMDTLEVRMTEKKYKDIMAYEQEYKEVSMGLINGLMEDGLAGMMRYLSDKLKAKAIEAVAESLWHVATGIAFLATPGLQGLAPGQFAAAAKFAAFAAMYGAGAVATGAIGGGGGGGDSGGVVAKEWKRSEMEKREVTVIIQAGVLTGQDAAKSIQDVLDQREKRLHASKPSKKVEL